MDKDLPYIDELVDIGRVAVFREKKHKNTIVCPEFDRNPSNRANITEEMCLMRVIMQSKCTKTCYNADILKKKHGYTKKIAKKSE